MSLFNSPPPEEEAKPLHPVGCWFRAVTGHFCFVIFIGLMLGISLIPAALCLYGFLSTGALVYVLGGILSGAVALASAGGYAFYQSARWELRLGVVLTNSLLLLFAVKWRTLLAGALWLALPAALVLWYPVVFPLCVITGLPVLMSVTVQAVFAPEVDRLMEESAKRDAGI